MRHRPMLLGLALLLAACQSKERVASLPPPEPPARAAPGLDPVAGEWAADRALALYAQPTTGSAVVARLGPGQPVTVKGRARGTDWIAVATGGGTGYVRLHLLRLRGEPRAAGPVIMPKPADNAGPAVKAAPRRKIEAEPLPAS
ncbi:SH3 domain-containing protein [Azospirillum sp. ST 5-10]|uniref:SH3 domain-containing protein n=1 Tax=unclassified Azospirillum TaxID=2630922 RepID=UPI003F4A74EF